MRPRSFSLTSISPSPLPPPGVRPSLGTDKARASSSEARAYRASPARYPLTAEGETVDKSRTPSPGRVDAEAGNDGPAATAANVVPTDHM
jgi:hypothetical protein